VNKPSPAIIAQSAVRRLPRLALLLFCVAYVLPGFLGRGPWKNADIAAFGTMRELAAGNTSWLHPQLLGQAGEFEALAPYWLGALAIKALPFFDPAFAARIPFALLLSLTLIATWYAVYYLARSPQAQPVAFAFGGEAGPVDYARAIADAGLLALIASLGLAQLSHETTPALAQLGFTALVFYAMAASAYRSAYRIIGPALGLATGLAGLALSGAPTVAVLLGAGSTLLALGSTQEGRADPGGKTQPHAWRWVLLAGTLTLGVALLCWTLDLWRWRIEIPGFEASADRREWRSLARLLIWFTWPTWPLAAWTLFRWRRQLTSRHVALPLWFAAVALGATVTTTTTDRNLILSLPPLAALAAFALPTLKRSVASLIDWFTLLFFTGCAAIIWIIWIAMQTGVPKQPAANVAKLAPGFEPSFSWLAFLAATLATLAWAWLVKWRAGRQQAAIWKSMVLPAGGATLCWLLLMTLWLPLLDYARSYAPLSRQLAARVNPDACVEVHGLNSAQVAALQYHGRLELRLAGARAVCPYLVVDAKAQAGLSETVDMPEWAYLATLRRPTDRNDTVALYKRVSVATPPAARPRP
jgi:4-amino-4-deoxy-L-arabinose transferase-like glycosyltransferase